MNYGQTSHDKDKEFIDDYEEQSEDIVEEIEKRPFKSSMLPWIGPKTYIPDTMTGARKNNVRADLPDTNRYRPAQIHDSTPWRTRIPTSTPRLSIETGEIISNPLILGQSIKRKKKF